MPQVVTESHPGWAEQKKIFPWTLGHSFIFKQDPVEEEDLRGITAAPVQPGVRAWGQHPAGAGKEWGGPFPGAGGDRDSARNPHCYGDSVCDPQRRDADGKNKQKHIPQHLDKLVGKGKDSQGLDMHTGEAHTDTRFSSLKSSLS